MRSNLSASVITFFPRHIVEYQRVRPPPFLGDGTWAATPTVSVPGLAASDLLGPAATQNGTV